MEDMWSELGIQPTSNTREIKRAYAKKLKSTRPDDDLHAFQSLREAYEIALIYAERSESYNFESSNLLTDNNHSEEKQELVTDDTNNYGFSYNDIPVSYNANQNIIQDETRSTAIKFADEVIHLIKSGGSESAAESLHELISSEQFINIELRQIFELNLLEKLSHEDTLPLFFLNKCIELFGWDDIDHPYRDRFHYIMWAATNSLAAIETKAFLEEIAYESNWTRISRNIGDKAPKAAKLLLKEWNPDHFRRQANSPSMAGTLRELLVIIQRKYGNGYRLVLDPNIVEFWEKTARAPRVKLWTEVITYFIFFTISKYLGDITIDVFLDSQKLVSSRNELINLAAFLISFPLTFVTSRILQRLLINKSDDIRSNIDKFYSTIKFIRYDLKAQIIFTTVSLTLVLALLQTDFYLVSIAVAYLVALYWLDRPIYILPLPIVALIFHVPASAFLFQVLDEVFPLHKIHLLSLFISYILLYTYIHTCKSMQFYYRPYAFSFVALICSLFLSNILHIDELKINPNYQLPSYRLTTFEHTKRKSSNSYLNNRQNEAFRRTPHSLFQEATRPIPRDRIFRKKKPPSDDLEKYFRVENEENIHEFAKNNANDYYHKNIQNGNHELYNKVRKQIRDSEKLNKQLLEKDLIDNNFRLNNEIYKTFE